MMHRFFFTAVFVGTFLFVAKAQAADSAGLTPETLEKLIRQLGDDNFRTRLAAGKALEQAGEEALAALRLPIRAGTRRSAGGSKS